jgi:hypothetical protein
VNAYNAIAVKEMIVNAIVHRDYERNEPVEVLVESKCITVTSPGGLIAEIAAQVGEQPFQQAIAEHRGSIKGYRNPAISDLFYGGGQMDRRGSGLSDMVVLTANNNGAVTFGPEVDNQQFTVTMEARPEAVDEITNTALPITEETLEALRTEYQLPRLDALRVVVSSLLDRSGFFGQKDISFGAKRRDAECFTGERDPGTGGGSLPRLVHHVLRFRRCVVTAVSGDRCQETLHRGPVRQRCGGAGLRRGSEGSFRAPLFRDWHSLLLPVPIFVSPPELRADPPMLGDDP